MPSRLRLSPGVFGELIALLSCADKLQRFAGLATALATWLPISRKMLSRGIGFVLVAGSLVTLPAWRSAGQGREDVPAGIHRDG